MPKGLSIVITPPAPLRQLYLWFLALAPGVVAVAAEEAGKQHFTVPRGEGALTISVQSPAPDRLAARPLLLLFFSADRASSLPDGRYGAPARVFLERGH